MEKHMVGKYGDPNNGHGDMGNRLERVIKEGFEENRRINEENRRREEENRRIEEENKRREEEERDESEIPKEWIEHIKNLTYTGVGSIVYEGLKNVESEESKRGSVATGEDVNRDSRAIESELRGLEEID